MKSSIFLSAITFFFGFNLSAQRVYTLQQCIDSALAHNVQVRRAAITTQQSEVAWRQAKANRLPNLIADFSQGLNQGRSIDPSTNVFVNQNVNGATYGAGSDVPVFSGGTLQNRVKENAFAYEASRFDEQQAKDVLVLNVILAYLSVLNGEDQVQLAYKTVAYSQSALDRLQVLNSQGAVRPSDVSDLNGQLMNDQLNILTAKNTVAVAKLSLARLMNQPYDSSIRLQRIAVDSVLRFYGAAPADIYQQSLTQFSLVKAANYKSLSSQYALRAAKGLRWPQLSFAVDINTRYSSLATNSGTKIPYPDQLRNFKNSFIGVGLTVPIFNRSYARNQIRLATLQLRDVALQEEDTKVQLRQQIDEAYVNMTQAYERYNLLLNQVKAYQTSFLAAEVRFKAGVGTSVDYLTAKDRFDQANINLLNAQYDFALRSRILDYYQGKTQ